MHPEETSLSLLVALAKARLLDPNNFQTDRRRTRDEFLARGRVITPEQGGAARFVEMAPRRARRSLWLKHQRDKGIAWRPVYGYVGANMT